MVQGTLLRHVAFVTVVAGVVEGQPLAAQTTVRGAVTARLSAAQIARRASPSVVTITTPVGRGSGVVLDPSGVIVTNLHVIRGQTRVSVKLANGDTYDAVSVIDVDERKDIVLLKVKAFGLATAAIGDSDRAQVGDRVVLIGSPQGLDLSVSDGLISAVRESGEGYRLFQTSAAASPGSSGGGMFNESGELIGIVASKVTTGENLNFAIPVNYVRGIQASESRMTLAELAATVGAESEVPRARSTVAGDTGLDRAEELAAILAASKLKWTDTGDGSWSTSFRGEHTDVVTVHLAVVGDLLVTQSIVTRKPRLSFDQIAELMRKNFSADLAKVALEEGDKRLIALHETELRLVDGPGLRRIVESVAALADDVAGTVVISAKGDAPPTTSPPPTVNEGTTLLSLLDGHASLRYRSGDWKPMASDEPGITQLQYRTGDLYVRVIAERIVVPLTKMPDIALESMRSAAADAKIVRRGYRNVNGMRMLVLELESTVSGIQFTFYGHYHSDVHGTLQIIGWTGRNLIDEHRGRIEEFVSGLSINR